MPSRVLVHTSALALALACVVGATTGGAAAARADGTGPQGAGTEALRSGRSAVPLSPAEHGLLMAGNQVLLPEVRRALGLTVADTFRVRSAVKDGDGTTHTRVERYHLGRQVVGGDLVVSRDRTGRLLRHHGPFTGPITIDLRPRMSSAEARRQALEVARQEVSFLGGAALTVPEVVVFVDRAGHQTLAYRSVVGGLDEEGTPARVEVLLDAGTGTTLRTADQVVGGHARRASTPRAGHLQVTLPGAPRGAAGVGHGVRTGTSPLRTTRTLRGYELRNPETGNYTTDARSRRVVGKVVTSATNQWGDGSPGDPASAAVDAQVGADLTSGYLKDVLSRNGLWDDGRGVRSRVHFDRGYANAFWDGLQMTYGDGEGDDQPLTQLDVAAHEMAHGVTENSAGLVYEGESGGLNEATSDILGTAVEHHARLAADPPDYRIGEQLDLQGDGTPLRYLDRPSADGSSPDCWSPRLADLDPHWSSGPLNHWYYLASEGSGARTVGGVRHDSPTCDGSTVTGAGHEAVERVWYRALTTRLTSTAGYAEAREGAIASAAELYGGGSQVCRSVESAFDAVGVPRGRTSCATVED